MTGRLLTGIVLAAATGGFALAGGDVDFPQPDVVDFDERHEELMTRDLEDAQRKNVLIGSSGAPASMIQNDRLMTFESNVEAQGGDGVDARRSGAEVSK